MTVKVRLSTDEIAHLVQRHRDGDNSAGWELVESQMGAIKQVALKWHLRPDLADDMISELMIVIFTALKTFDPTRGSISLFVFNIALRRAPRIAKKIRPTTFSSVTHDSQLVAKGNVVEQLYIELHEAAGLSQLEVDLLVMIAKGIRKSVIYRRLKNEYRDMFAGVPASGMVKRLETIRDNAVARLRDSLEIEPGSASNLSSTELEEAVCRLARVRHGTSASLIYRSLRSRGSDVSLTAVQQIMRKNKLSNKSDRLAAIAC